MAQVTTIATHTEPEKEVNQHEKERNILNAYSVLLQLCLIGF